MGVPVYPGMIFSKKGVSGAAFVPIGTFGAITGETVVNDQVVGLGVTAPIAGPVRAGVFGVSDYNFSEIQLAAGVNFKF